MLSALLLNRDTYELREIAATQLMDSRPANASFALAPEDNKGFQKATAQCRAGELMWLDVTAPDDDDFKMLAERFGLHTMVIEDVRAREGRPKLHDYGDYLYIVCHAVSMSEKTETAAPAVQIEEIDILIGADYVVTIHQNDVSALHDLKSRWKRRPELMKNGAGYLLYEIMDEILDDYFPLLDLIDERIDDFEERLFREFEENLSADIFALKRQLIQIRRVAGPTRDVVNILLRHDADSGGRNFAYFQDLYDHSSRIVENVDTFRELMSGALDAYLALASNRMNSVMKTLTSASIILLVPTLIAGIYGMNFKYMPELERPNGYPGALFVMLAVIIALACMFKRKGWL
ncbi:MAG TPA: magnesium/cobalt transporter CorA [Abditibacteriaceae bacterium]|jgi:magnesium transporter